MNTICQPQMFRFRRRIVIFSAILVLMGLLCTPQLKADIYQWIDENGVKHFSNKSPANSVNARTVFKERQYDETMHQKRIKSDQKAADAFNEEVEKEEQQANVEEQIQFKAEKQNQPFFLDRACFSPSYSIQQGRGARHRMVPRELMSGEFEDLLALFDSLKGGWYGTAWKRTCEENEGEVRQATGYYRITSAGEMATRGHFILKSTLHPRSSQESRSESELPFYLDSKKIATERDISVSNLELVSLSSDHLIYVQKGRGDRFMSNRKRRDVETVTTLKKTGDYSFSCERIFYKKGKLRSISTWHLEKN